MPTLLKLDCAKSLLPLYRSGIGANQSISCGQFRSLLRQSSQFSNYNFREYARRRTLDAFREHQKESEDRRIQELIQDGLQNLRMMKVSKYSRMDMIRCARVCLYYAGCGL